MKCSHGYTRTSELCPTCDNRGRVLPLEIKLAQLRAEVAELRKALEWYAEEARALAENVAAQKDMAILASVQVLALDAGKRASNAAMAKEKDHG